MDKLSQRLFSWASILDANARDQARTASTMPFIYPHLALMPDAHLGKGATVGSVIPTLGAIIPAAVGVDIGCGMIAVRTTYTAEDLAFLVRLAERGQYRSVRDRSFDLEDVVAAHRFVDAGRKRGNVVLRMPAGAAAQMS